MNSEFDRRVDRTGTGSLKWSRYEGRDILPFWVADMDFQSAACIREALDARVKHGVYGYTLPPKKAVDAVLAYLRDQQDITAEKDWLIWLPGLVPALNIACRAYVRREEGVIACSPVYPPFLTAPVNQRRTLVHVPLTSEGGRYTFDWTKLESMVTHKTRMFMLCNPHNPVGRVFTREELAQLSAFCAKHELIICSDEIHCDLVLKEGIRHSSILTMGEAVANRSVMLMSPSKTYNTPGLACAFAVIPNPRLRTRFQRAMRGMLTEVNAFGYEACAAAYGEAEPWRQDLIRYLRGNYEYLRSFINERLPELKVWPLEATYLAWIDPSALGVDDPVAFFENGGVGLSNGKDFGQAGMVRLNFGCPRSMLEEGLLRMEKSIIEHRAQVLAGSDV